MAIRMQQRRGTAAQWTSTNPVLAAGEIGWESDTNKFKMGDGVNQWEDLDYFLNESQLEGSIDDFIPLTQKGVANGVATLNSSGKVPYEQIPSIDELSQDAVNAALTAGTGITKTYDDNANTITISADTSVLATKAELAEVSQDSVNDALVAGTGITKTYNDNANTITVAVDTSTIAPLSGPTFTGTVTLPSTTSIGDVSATEIGYINGVTSAIQTQIDGKAASSHTHTLVDVTDVTATAAELNVLDGITASTAELNYVDGVTSAIQTQLDSKAASSHSHAISDVTNLQTSLDAKLSLAGGTMTGALTLAGAPNNALDAATKAYVDAVTEGLHIHPSVVAATTANVDISTALEPGDVVDGVTLVQGDRILVKSQTNAAQNGIYVVQASGAALRASDFNEPQEVDGGDFVFVTGGTLGDNTGWVQTTANVVTIGTDPIVFTQFSGAGTYQAGTGLTLTDNIFSINTSTTIDTTTAQTLTNKTIALSSNTISGTLADFNAAVTDADLAPIASPTFTGTVTLPSTTSIGDVSSTELGYVNGVTSAIQTQLDGKAASSHTHAQADITNLTTDLAAKAPLASPTFTGTVVLPSTTSIGDVSSTELGYVNGVTSAIQTQLDSKAAKAASINTRTSNYTLQASDAGNIVEINSASAIAVTIPADSTLDLPVGTSIDIVNISSGEITISNEAVTGPNYGIWTTSTTSVSIFRINDVTHNGLNLWLAGGYSDYKVIQSTDGISWTTTSAFSGNPYGAVDAIGYGNGLWIAGDEYGDMVRSTNGTVWSAITTPFAQGNSIKTITYANNLWIASGYNVSGPAEVFSSTNGTAWSAVTSNFNGQTVEKISFGNGLWVMVGVGGRIRTSTNGSAWTTATSNFGSTDIKAVAYGNGLWVAGGAAGQMRTSTDGSTWTTVTSNFGSTVIESVSYGNGIWFAAGRAGQMRTSTNGSTWTTATSNFGTTNILAVSNFNNTWIATGEGGQIRRADYATSFAPTILSKDSNKKITSQYAGATAYKRAANEWVVIGDLSA